MGRDSGHSVTCADAVRTTAEQCECICDGYFHGGPHTERARALVWAPEKRRRYSQTQVRGAKKAAREALAAKELIGEACTDFAVTYVINEFIFATELDRQRDARDVLKAIVEPLVAEIAKAELDYAEAKAVTDAVNYLHLLCSLCVEVLKLIGELDELADDVAEDIAESVAASLADDLLLTKAVKLILTKALARSFRAAIDLVKDPAMVLLLRLAGFVLCPNIAEHPDVEKYCVSPLEQEWATESLRNWITDGFQPDSSILKRAPRRPATV
ncbi:MULTISPECIES: hypothetical protein [Plantibacter]|uniref:hypothetical protein n=1 Tax=Plantibacter TaxID=190323 RepID=UPI0010C231AF|nr:MULTISPECIES: hypothetical protein [Plantibacter]MBD8103795.1 hypothetical protein [Plantibacter sp. CFBP 8775]MBD8467244.1 hypothetical protein [Plantibacter sp. CFBP 8798]